MLRNFIKFVRKIYNSTEFIPLHSPIFIGNERKYVNDAITSTFVSSVGKYVDSFEKKFSEFVGAKHAIATVNGTAALHIALKLAGVEFGDEVITQPLTFVATGNVIKYCGAEPIFVDVDKKTLGLSANKLNDFLLRYTRTKDALCYNKVTGRIIRACIPMHTFGQVVEIADIKKICDKHHVALVEDCAEALGSRYENIHTGNFSCAAAFSFNGNKILTTGGGGMIITNNSQLAKIAKHLTTTAKLPHSWEYIHDMIGYNYRLPNINAALGCAQLEILPKILDSKYKIAERYKKFFMNTDVHFITPKKSMTTNYWLNTILVKDKLYRDQFLKETNAAKIMTRPAWNLLNSFSMFKNCFKHDLSNASWLVDRLINIPSSAIL